MSELTSLTLKGAIEGLASKRFSSEELTRAHSEAVEAARPLNAYVMETPDKALAMARASDERIAKGEAGPLEGLPLGIKDLYCTEGVRTTAGSRMPLTLTRSRAGFPAFWLADSLSIFSIITVWRREGATRSFLHWGNWA